MDDIEVVHYIVRRRRRRPVGVCRRTNSGLSVFNKENRFLRWIVQPFADDVVHRNERLIETDSGWIANLRDEILLIQRLPDPDSLGQTSHNGKQYTILQDPLRLHAVQIDHRLIHADDICLEIRLVWRRGWTGTGPSQ